VYRSFNDVETMLEELEALLNRKKAGQQGSDGIFAGDNM
jgi:hypothetical protein